jgi:hypothetical protein
VRATRPRSASLAASASATVGWVTTG